MIANKVLIEHGLRLRAEIAAIRHDMSLVEFYAEAVSMQIARLDAADGEPCPACGQGGSDEWKARAATWLQRLEAELAEADTT